MVAGRAREGLCAQQALFLARERHEQRVARRRRCGRHPACGLQHHRDAQRVVDGAVEDPVVAAGGHAEVVQVRGNRDPSRVPCIAAGEAAYDVGRPDRLHP